MVLLEAGAAGRASVTTDVPGCRDVIEHGVNGLLVPPRDSGALAAGLGELLEDRARRGEMGAAARTIVERNFSTDHVIRRLEDVYRQGAGLTL